MVWIKLPLLPNFVKWLVATVIPDYDIEPPLAFLETLDANIDEPECCGGSNASIDSVETIEDTTLRHFSAVL